MESEEKKWLSELFQISLNLRSENDELKKQMNYIWQPIKTAPIKQRILILYKDKMIGTRIYDDKDDIRDTYAVYWMPIPPFPKL